MTNYFNFSRPIEKYPTLYIRIFKNCVYLYRMKQFIWFFVPKFTKSVSFFLYRTFRMKNHVSTSFHVVRIFSWKYSIFRFFLKWYIFWISWQLIMNEFSFFTVSRDRSYMDNLYRYLTPGSCEICVTDAFTFCFVSSLLSILCMFYPFILRSFLWAPLTFILIAFFLQLSFPFLTLWQSMTLLWHYYVDFQLLMAVEKSIVINSNTSILIL